MMVRLLAAGGVGILAVAALWWSGSSRNPAPVPVTPPASLPDGGRRLSYRGLAIQVATGHRPLETYGPLLAEIAALGANTVLLSVAGYMEHATSQSIYIDARKVPSPADFQALIRRARELKLRPIVMPIVLLRNPRGSEWRGVIDPPDWDDWWRQYTDFVLYFADIARAGQADALMVGSELVSTEKYTARWVKVIETVRPRFGLPECGEKLGYSANWDHYRPVEFWDRLDFIGMTSYYTLADKKGPTVEEIMAKWEPIKRDILEWQRGIGKPLLLAEVGWCSQEGAAMAPWNYYQNQRATPAALEEQRRLYEAFIRVWNNTPELMGVIWWEWNASAGGPGDYGYTPKNKPAEQVLRRWFTGDADADAARPGSAPAVQ
ncbi:MAG: hypothetical protein AB1601_07890 [Planctomycetota bacterium]